MEKRRSDSLRRFLLGATSKEIYDGFQLPQAKI
jgi:hypothetical protein